MSSTGTLGPVINYDALVHHYHYYTADLWFLAFCLACLCTCLPWCLICCAARKYRELNTVTAPGALTPKDVEAQVLLTKQHGRNAR